MPHSLPKQKHVTSGSTCLTPPAVREGSSPQNHRATSSSEVLQRRSTHSHKAHSATGLNTREVGGHVLLLKMKKKKSTIFKEHLHRHCTTEEHYVTYMGTYRVELYRASQQLLRLRLLFFNHNNNGNTALNRDLFPSPEKRIKLTALKLVRLPKVSLQQRRFSRNKDLAAKERELKAKQN